VKIIQKENKNISYHPIPSIWGHWAGGPGTNVEDVNYIDSVLKKFFAE